MGSSKSSNLKKYKIPFKEISLIFWKDAFVTTDDNPKLEHKDDLTISIGVIVDEKDDEITISSFYDGIGQGLASPFQVIPKGVIKQIKKISCKNLKIC